MSEVIKISTARAKNAQHAQMATDVLEKITQETANKLGFGTQWEAFSAKARLETKHFKPERKLLATSEVKRNDSERDHTLHLYRLIAKAYAIHAQDKEKQAAGKVLTHLFKQARDAAKKDYASQTAMFTSLTKELRKEPYVLALKTLNLSSAPDDIDAANLKFNQTYAKRSGAAQERAMYNTQQLRKETDAALRELTKVINALFAVNELITRDDETRAALQQIIDDLNAIFYRFRKTVKSNRRKLRMDN